ncbi:hypothetical protein [Aliarcobacter vitoriensis]|uniref:Uncharacterized protein n=1 Tax=Aliarcobacter vitoriensis TaxID=2011099 RepID=A0A366MV56_9BACT|nr:hypothetical protein [Aliarcobacter vitoriensis]RBQ29484.1 hypothetical protein CRU91_03900 [Aliarcobacter vitoriensis]
MLNSVKNSFETSSLKIKIELYILPILVLLLIYILFYQQNSEDFAQAQNIELINLENKKYDKSTLELLNDIEEIAKQNNVFIQKSENSKDDIFLQAKSKKSDLLNFLHKIEILNNFTNIYSLSLKKVGFDDYLFDLRIDISKFYIKKIEQKYLLKNDEITETIEDIKEEKIDLGNSQKIDFEIGAIVGKYAFINNTWVELNDYISNYKLDFISRDFVLLKKDENIIKLEVNSIEYFKNSN